MTILPITPEQTYPLRHAVLWPDKPYSFVRVDNDHEGYHYGAFEGEELIAVISLFVYPDDGRLVARFRKFATHPDWQRKGVGSQLMRHIRKEALRMEATRLWCDARLDAADFYRRFGMEPISDVFYKGPIPYAAYAVDLSAHS
ncbi:GNAT family N-acetyltransferase [uncultured Spirosoma sp.]|uniref:GNAT family N-acetyltransferase n=1 Tax=uncultured Spirosoma sp. TaxID=278208 RepID=UPI00258B4125|nr:GNAT family N-acetyltransferase [uncultured Spirosoma sp.]